MKFDKVLEKYKFWDDYCNCILKVVYCELNNEMYIPNDVLEKQIFIHADNYFLIIKVSKYNIYKIPVNKVINNDFIKRYLKGYKNREYWRAISKKEFENSINTYRVLFGEKQDDCIFGTVFIKESIINAVDFLNNKYNLDDNFHGEFYKNVNV